MNTVAIDVQELEEPAWLARAAAFAVKVMDAAALDAWDLSLLLCGQEFIAGLNKEYRGKDGPTDVLSFSLGEWYESESGRRYMAGDVVLCPPVMARNAVEFGVTEDEELRRLIIHGILHLSGLDHQTNDIVEPMLARQEELLVALAEERIF
ncbi:MAG TPA: rRNA maturation RNase YbeY [bacterium]|nr:rRNA maturation RNase YbeY [bacterium]